MVQDLTGHRFGYRERATALVSRHWPHEPWLGEQQEVSE